MVKMDITLPIYDEKEWGPIKDWLSYCSDKVYEEYVKKAVVLRLNKENGKFSPCFDNLDDNVEIKFYESIIPTHFHGMGKILTDEGPLYYSWTAALFSVELKQYIYTASYSFWIEY